jgi:hypothetical protein
MSDSPFISNARAAERMGIHVNTLQVWQKKEMIPLTKYGDSGYLLADFERWLAEGAPRVMPQPLAEVTPLPVASTDLSKVLFALFGGEEIEFTITIRPTAPAVGRQRVANR